MKFKNLLQNHWTNFNQTWKQSILWMRIQIGSNEGPIPFSKGDDNEIAKIHWRNLKILFSRTAGESLNQTWHKTFLRDGDSKLFKWRATLYFPKGDNNEIVENHWPNLKIFFSKTTRLIQTNLAQDILGYWEFKCVQIKFTPFSKGR